MERATVDAWVSGYEQAWRTPGTAALAALFAPDATYLVSPWAEPVVGLDAIAALWEAERTGPDEVFSLASEVVAVDGATAVVRLAVGYGDPVTSRWRDLWVLRFDGEGRCAAFEEWPFAPDQPDGHTPEDCVSGRPSCGAGASMPNPHA
ncbi:MAG TPA: nuclear transport factor 2 family protein [Acidimicrobiales bacterium]|nr:nuclear transport factor 2 family protein [Acidimicrobiales bacterium]